ncbi:MAG: CHAT domain-containing protein [Okeania sp. SIO3B5]|uniref:VMAP-C domain-containing protein n=1 Tax=Okeania sp. SIO3B5 TaxID=2607811 RepID=UPI0013FEC878|nr:CHAT domain-containing protein [Okeania sp. SIO3B5]NEO54121.1 CHAT domain-containing protein [Okeania sp. SIO3B5]
MSKTYCTYRICLNNRQRIQIEKIDIKQQLQKLPYEDFDYQEKQEEIQKLLEIANNNELDKRKIRQLGESLFDSLFNSVLRQDFLSFYFQVVQKEKQLLRVELDIDEQELPDIAALPWEFLRLPEGANQGTLWLATNPNLVFSRRRSLWNLAQPIQLAEGEKLRIALAISAPQNLGNVEYVDVEKSLKELAEKSEEIELLPIINPATQDAIDNLLEQEPHIFHLIGHGKFEEEEGEKVGKIALVREGLNRANWIDAEDFADLFNRHIPGVVVLQVCEGAKQSESEAFRGVAAKIVAQNIPVVVAMQYEVANATANAFSAEFYKRLAKGEPVDIAAQNGRRKIAMKTNSINRDFATPVIFMRVEDGYLFQKKKIESDVLSETSKYKNFANTTHSNIVENKPIDDNNYVYLAIDLKLESAKIQKNDPDKYWVKTWLAIPESFQKFSFENLSNTFKTDKTYSQVDIEENIPELIKECNENLEEILPEKYPKIAIEWILPGDLLSLPVDCWEYRKKTRIGWGKFHSVHIRSSQRLAYKHYYQSWKDKWNDLQEHIQKINLSHYILACQCQNQDDNCLKIVDRKKNILGINFPSKLEELENISYELMIETGIPIALWSRCKESNVNHLLDLDTLINPSNDNVLNLKKLPEYVEDMRLAASSNQPNHLGHHLCFLWENPYNYPKKRRLG